MAEQGTIALAAGGTGGHLFPAQALAEELNRRGYSVHLMTDERVRDYGKSFPAAETHIVHAATITPSQPLKVPGQLLKLYGGYRATVDWPGCHFYAQLADRYPQAKVILSLRDPERWYDSMSNTILPGMEKMGLDTLTDDHPMLFGGLIILFLVVEPEGLNRLWRNIRNYFRVWPFSY